MLGPRTQPVPRPYRCITMRKFPSKLVRFFPKAWRRVFQRRRLSLKCRRYMDDVMDVMDGVMDDARMDGVMDFVGFPLEMIMF